VTGLAQPLHVAVVGAGPSGVYAADALTKTGDPAVTVDVLDRLPTPFGLVRYGVAPDHLKIKSVANALVQVLSRPGVRFLGDVTVGDPDAGAVVSVAELRRHADAVVWAFGAARDRRLDIPGEELAGSVAATDFVSWYSGHPDAALQPVLAASAVAVIGVGNVAVDVARILTKDVGALRETDLHTEVLDALTSRHVRDVHVVGRRGPAYAKWTTKELRELGELTDVDVVVDPADLELDAAQEEVVAASALARRNVEALRGFPGLTGAPRRIHLHFGLRPERIVEGDVSGAVGALVLAPATGGAEVTMPVQAVVRSVGYRGAPLAGVPFDEASGTIPHADGRVLRGGEVSVGEYATGWIKRGPTGIIGTNRGDSLETVTALLADAPGLPRVERDPDALAALVTSRGGRSVTLEGWLRIDAAELARGQAAGRGREKIADLAALRAAAHGG